MNKGYMYVASLHETFYDMACMSAESIKDFYPEANITLFTHEMFVTKRADIFDNIITGIPAHKRAKMWAAARTPYDSTAYLDCDTFIYSEDIKDLLDYNNDNDISFQLLQRGTEGRPEWAYADRKMTMRFKYHGGIYTFKKTDLTMDFFQTWFDEYHKQITQPLKPYLNPENSKWDMLTLWRLFNEKEFERFQKLKVGHIDDKYNCTSHSNPNENITIFHYNRKTLQEKKNAKVAATKSERDENPFILR